MADNTAIEWCDTTWNPIRARNKATGKIGWHCEHVSEGCRNCYAEAINLRLGTGLPFKPGHRKDVDIFVDEKMLEMPTRWRKPRRIFVESMSDGAGDFVTDHMLDAMLKEMSFNHRHTFIVLTKRPERLNAYLKRFKPSPQWDGWITRDGVVSNDIPRGEPIFAPDRWPLRNVWIGTSVEDQPSANARIPILLDTPAALRFLSMEPLLGPVDLRRIKVAGGWYDSLNGWRDVKEQFPGIDNLIDWVIGGGESGPKARPMHPDWARLLRNQCADAEVPFFFKQWGEWGLEEAKFNSHEMHAVALDGTLYKAADLAWPDGSRRREALDAGHDHAALHSIFRLGKKAAGRLLDGVEHNGFPPPIARGQAS